MKIFGISYRYVEWVGYDVDELYKRGNDKEYIIQLFYYCDKYQRGKNYLKKGKIYFRFFILWVLVYSNLVLLQWI